MSPTMNPMLTTLFWLLSLFSKHYFSSIWVHVHRRRKRDRNSYSFLCFIDFSRDFPSLAIASRALHYTSHCGCSTSVNRNNLASWTKKGVRYSNTKVNKSTPFSILHWPVDGIFGGKFGAMVCMVRNLVLCKLYGRTIKFTYWVEWHADIITVDFWRKKLPCHIFNDKKYTQSLKRVNV